MEKQELGKIAYRPYFGIQYNTIQFRLMAQKTPQLTQTQLRITRERKKLNNIAYWKRQGDEYFLSYFMIAEKHKFH